MSPGEPLRRGRAEPLYHQLETALKARLEAGEWLPGAQFPNEERLCEEYGVSRITVRQALRELVQRGLIVRRQGRGTFVADSTLTAGVRGLMSFTDEMQALGRKVSSRLLQVEIRPATDEAAVPLGLEAGEPIVRIQRLRLSDEHPVAIQVAHLPARLVPGIEDTDFATNSLYDVLENQYGLVPVEAVETIRVRRVTASEAELLAVGRGQCAFRITRVTVGRKGPFEMTHSVIPGDQYEVRLVLRADRNQ
jgi:GntR family transcriptional regulator